MVSVLAFIVAKFSLQDFKQTMLKYFVASFLGCFRITECSRNCWMPATTSMQLFSKKPRRPLQVAKSPHFCEHVPVCSATWAWQDTFVGTWFLGWVGTTFSVKKRPENRSPGFAEPFSSPSVQAQWHDWVCHMTH